MTDFLNVEFTYGDDPASPVASDVALEAGVTEAEAQAMIAASWIQAETFTKRCYRPVTAGKLVLHTDEFSMIRWPRYPFPDEITVEREQNGSWLDASNEASFLSMFPEAGILELYEFTTYRITQVGTVTPPAPSANVVQAVTNLALYQLVQMPQRREFKNQTAGDTSLTRENLMGLFHASGAGILLANEVRQ